MINHRLIRLHQSVAWNALPVTSNVKKNPKKTSSFFPTGLPNTSAALRNDLEIQFGAGKKNKQTKKTKTGRNVEPVYLADWYRHWRYRTMKLSFVLQALSQIRVKSWGAIPARRVRIPELIRSISSKQKEKQGGVRVPADTCWLHE